jgi:sugar O-acyltransferase (sialic acid O-acetyltransferase NeuD family)
MPLTEPIFIFGAGGHGKVVASVVEEEALYRIVSLADDDPSLKGKDFFGYPIVGSREDLVAKMASLEIAGGLVAVGDNRQRLDAAEWFGRRGFRLVKTVHPSAQVARGVTIDVGTVIMAGTVVNADSAIGRAVIINTSASVDHDCVIGDGVHIAPGCHLCGTVKVGRASFIGAGSIVIPGTTIGQNVLIGAGSVVIRDVPSDARVAGNPARPLGEGSREG